MRRRELLAGLALFSAACNRSGKKVIGVIPKGSTHTFWQTVHAGAIKVANENGVEILWNAPAQEGDRSRQIAIVESMINQRVAGIALAPVDRAALSHVVERATDAGIPVAIFDSAIDTPKRVAYVATDNRNGGRIAARRLAEVLEGKGKVLVVSDTPGSASTTERDIGFDEEIKKSPGIQVLPVQFCYADRAKAMALVENHLAAHSDLAGIFADHENAASGTTLALRSRGKRTVKLVAFDVSEQLVADLKEGWIDSLLVQNPFKMGEEVVKALLAKIGGGTPAAETDTGITLVRAEMLEKPEIKQLLFPDIEKYLKAG
jgi:ribose transport system substrate-binding protein